ncbi:MAG TPA: hypothetical protein VF158_07245 [Longimicrobiales bacterium]
MAPWPNDPSDPGVRTMMRKVVWPMDDGQPERRRRRAVEPEPWECEWEPFEGARALEDLARTAGDARGSAAVVARYVVVRVVERSEAGEPEWRLLEECAAAAEYLTADHALAAAERAALEAVLRGVAGRKSPELAAALVEAGRCAARAGHFAGSFALFLAAYRVALARGWSGAASRVAAAIAELARAGGGRRSERRWRRRAAVLARRAARQADDGARRISRRP